MKTTKNLLLILLFCLTGTLYGQQQITGTVTPASGDEALVGVTISVKGTQKGTITDVNGAYSIAAEANDTLVFSYIGYNDEEIGVNNRSVIDVELVQGVSELDEVVVIGYGSIKKSDLTGSVASVSEVDFNPGPKPSVSDLLQNTAPGVVLQQGSAQPGGNYNIRVRGTTSLMGSNSPLYVIDGMPVINSTAGQQESISRYVSSPAKNPLNGINPEDIVSIEVLKDASAAAIYGARGANGVVLITTKQGQEGAATVSYDYSASMQEISNEYEMLNASQFARESNEFATFTGAQPLFSAEEVNNFGEGTDWMDQITRTGTVQNHQLSVSGGQNFLNYYISGNYYENKGIIQNTALERYSGRVNLNARVSDKLNVGLNVTLSQTADDQVHFGRTGGGEDEFAGLFDNTRTWSPTLPVRQPDGSFTQHPAIGVIPNPVSLLDIDDQIHTLKNLGTIFGEYEIIPGLKAKVNLGFDKSEAKRAYYIPTTVYRGEQVNGEGSISQNMISSLLGEFTLNYSLNTGDHQLNLLGGYTYQQFNSEGFGTKATNFASERTNIHDISGASNLDPSFSFKETSKLLSYISRAQYILRDKYLFTFTMRADGSTRFGENSKWGFFPSGAAAWKIANEDFYNLEAMNNLKLRVSYGLTGNQEFANKQSQQLYGSTNPIVFGNPGQTAVGLRPIRPGDPGLKWETTSQFNPGLDVAFFRNRLQATFDYYYKVTSDVLLSFELPSTAGFATQTTNAGEILNTGYEISVTSKNITGEFNWNTNINFAYNNNSWKDRAGYYTNEIEDEFGPVGGTYGYIVDGIFQQNDDIPNSPQPNAEPGMFRFRDVNGRDGNGELTGEPDGNIDGDDRVLLGYWQPDYTFGINNIINFRNFDLSFFFQGMMGHEKENFQRAQLEFAQGLERYQNRSVAVLDRWTPSNPSNTIPSGELNPYGSQSLNSKYVEDASFVRLRNLTVGYTFPDFNINGNRAFEKLRIYVDAQNLFLITGYKGLDPETDVQNQYPSAVTYTLGLNVDF